MNTGKVLLVGAGPGDPELLTLKAVRALAAANVVLVDDLVHPDVLAHAAAHARIVHVGKRGGCASTPQAYIDRLMIAEARAGRCVVRLKGGDPCLFGRGGEEMEALRAAGVAVEIVNGITAGIAAATSAGVPLTHRDHAHGVAFVTGHAAVHGAGPDWHALVQSRLTLVIYMGVARCGDFVGRLLAAGMRRDMPVLAVEGASRTGERRVATTLERLPRDVVAHRIASPAVFIVGPAVACAARLVASPAPAHWNGAVEEMTRGASRAPVGVATAPRI